MSTPYLDLAGFRLRTVMPTADVDLVESLSPGFIEARIGIAQSKIDSRLRKRYAIPLASPVSEIVLGWLVAIVTPEAYRARGVNPHDPQLELVEKDRDAAWLEIREAADSKDGLYDLPLAEDTQSSAVTAGGPLSYSEQSPYTWMRLQACAAREEES